MNYNFGFNNGFMPPGAAPLPYSGGFQPPAPLPMAPQMSQPSSNGIIWVQGESAAKSHYVAPGTSAMLMDSEAERFYLKSVDAAGVPSMRIFKYTEETAAPPVPVSTAQYVTREEYDQLRRDYDEIRGRLDRMTAEPPRKAARKSGGDADAEPAV